MRTVEGAVFIAALEDDRAEVRRLLRGLLPGELRGLDRACELIYRVMIGLDGDPTTDQPARGAGQPARGAGEERGD